MTNVTNNTNNICPTCGDRDLGPDGTCILCFEANSCVKHKELRDPIAGCNSCLMESGPFVTKAQATGKKLSIDPLPVHAPEAVQIPMCPLCQRITQEENDKYCVDCLEVRRLEHVAKVQDQADRYFEGKTKLQAIELMCAVANGNCLSMYDTWLYKYGVEKFGITRADYYNDYDGLTEEAKEYISDNWKPLTENHLERLTADLERELQGIESMSKRFVQHIQDDKLHHLRNTAYYYKMVAELVEAVERQLPPTGGKKIWEL